MNISRDFARIIDKLKSSGTAQVPMHCLETDEESFVFGMLTIALSLINRVELAGSAHFILKELLNNAEKAIVKSTLAARDPQVLQHYFDAPESVRATLKSKKPQIVFTIAYSEDGLVFEVENEGVLADADRARIEEAINLSWDGITLSELKSTAQAKKTGCGLALCKLVMERAWISPESLRYNSRSNKTVFSLTIPSFHTEDSSKHIIAQEVIKEVESLPAFPDRVLKIKKLCDSEESDISQISMEIAKDTSIAAMVIRIANSGGFAGGNIDTLSEAVKIIGLKFLSGILLQTGVISVFQTKYGNSEEFIKHPGRVAAYARVICKKFKLSESPETIYTGGLLHDIGKVVLLAAMKNNKEFNAFKERGDRRTAIEMEEISSGINHAKLGALLAKHWNFPEELISMIDYHHMPSSAPESDKDLVYTVYLANSMEDISEGTLNYYAIDAGVLERFNLTSNEAFQMITQSIKSECRFEN